MYTVFEVFSSLLSKKHTHSN